MDKFIKTFDNTNAFKDQNKKTIKYKQVLGFITREEI